MDSSSGCAPQGVATSSGDGGRTDESASPPRPRPTSQRFGAADRILRSSDFDRVYCDGRKLVGPSYVVFVLPNTMGRPRLGITVGRKVGGAVVRNRTKRIVREIFRKNRAAFIPSSDHVVNVRHGATALDYAALERELLATIARARREQLG